MNNDLRRSAPIETVFHRSQVGSMRLDEGMQLSEVRDGPHEPATCHGEEDARPDDDLVLSLGDGVPASSGDADGDDENEKDESAAHLCSSIPCVEVHCLSPC